MFISKPILFVWLVIGTFIWIHLFISYSCIISNIDQFITYSFSYLIIWFATYSQLIFCPVLILNFPFINSICFHLCFLILWLVRTSAWIFPFLSSPIKPESVLNCLLCTPSPCSAPPSSLYMSFSLYYPWSGHYEYEESAALDTFRATSLNAQK